MAAEKLISTILVGMVLEMLLFSLDLKKSNLFLNLMLIFFKDYNVVNVITL